MESMAASWTDI